MISTQNRRTNVVLWYGIFVIALSLFTVLYLTRAYRPLALDELHGFVAAKGLYTIGVPIQYQSPGQIQAARPHFHLRSMELAFRVFGVSEATARLPGLASLLIAIIMVFLITKSFSQGSHNQRVQWAALSGLLYASTPAVIQGSAIADADNTVLIPAVLFLLWSFLKYQGEEKVKWALLTGLATGIALWARVTTSTMAAFFLVLLVLFSKKESKPKLICIGAILSGSILFVVSWYLYCATTGVPFSGPFTNIAFNLGQNTLHSSGGQMGSRILQSLIYLTLWVGLFPLLLLFSLMKRNFSNFLKYSRLRPEDVLLLSGLFIMGVYILLAGPHFGYIRYHSPAIPLLYIYIGIALSKLKVNLSNQRLLKTAVIALAAFAIQVFIVGDFLYTIRYTLRESLAFMSPPYDEILRSIALKTILFCAGYAILFTACLKFSFKNNTAVLLLIFAIGSNSGVSFLQSAASYQTGYNYGGRGMIEAARYIRDRVPAQSTVIAPHEITYYADLPSSTYVYETFWTDTDGLRESLIDQKTSGLVFSIATNTIPQIRTISRDSSIQELLRQNYDHKKIGSYMIWIRKSKLPKTPRSTEKEIRRTTKKTLLENK